MIFLVSCNTKSSNNDFSNLNDYYEYKANEVRINGDYITFNDDSGRNYEITLKRGYERIVSLYASYTTLLYEAGGSVIATIGGKNAIELYEQYIGRNILETDKVQIVANNSAGSSFSVEKILSFKPDFVIASNAMDGYAKISQPIIEAGIPIIAVNYNDFSDYLKWFKIFSFLANKEHLYEEIAKEALKEIENIVIEAKEKPAKNVLAIFPNASSPTACTRNTLIGKMLEELSSNNIISNDNGADKVPINLESIYASNPDIILVNCHNSIEEAKEIINKYFENQPLWNNLEAVKSNKVIYLEKNLFHNKPNSHFKDAYKKLANILYEN